MSIVAPAGANAVPLVGTVIPPVISSSALSPALEFAVRPFSFGVVEGAGDGLAGGHGHGDLAVDLARVALVTGECWTGPSRPARSRPPSKSPGARSPLAFCSPSASGKVLPPFQPVGVNVKLLADPVRVGLLLHDQLPLWVLLKVQVTVWPAATVTVTLLSTWRGLPLSQVMLDRSQPAGTVSATE